MLQPRDESRGYFQSPSGLGKGVAKPHRLGKSGAEVPAGFYATENSEAGTPGGCWLRKEQSEDALWVLI
jgi:hypothetical protein